MGFIKNFIKKFSALLPPIGLLIAAGLLFVVMFWLGGKVNAQMSQSQQQAQTVRSLSANVPSRQKPEQVKRYMNQLENEVEQIETLMRQSSQRQLVAYNIFPKPQDTSSQIFTEFAKAYRAAIEALLTDMNALDAPSEAEIRSRTGGSTRQQAAGAMATRRIAVQDPMVDALCLARAESISVYAAPSVFPWHTFWQTFEFEGTNSAMEDCWNAQVALWIYEDVVQTIQAMNIGSNRVSTSPVKRLLGVRFSGPVPVGGDQLGSRSAAGGMFGGPMPTARGQGQVERDIPGYVTPEVQSVFVPTPWTERVGGDEYDIIHFAVSVIVDNRHVLDFMRELCSEKEHTFREEFRPDGRVVTARRNQITILENTVSVVDKESPAHELYRYGGSAAMRLDVVCEYVFNREGYDSLKPESIKKALGQQDMQGGGGGDMYGTGGFTF